MRRPWQAIVVGSTNGSEIQAVQRAGRTQGKKQRMLTWLAERGWDRVTEQRASELGSAFPDYSEETKRAALLESSLMLDPLVEGVRQENYERLEATLCALLQEYEVARESGNTARRQAVRALVIRAKEHAELAARNRRTHDEKRGEKIEMATWLRTWLENPPVFPSWVALRKRQIGLAPAGRDTADSLESE